jgi:phage tail-like protein
MTASDAMLGMTMRFLVTIDKHTSLASWSKASGLEVTWDLVEYRAGDNDNERWIFPGLAKYPTVKLERAANATDSAAVREWLNNTSFKHKTGESAKIELQDANLTKVAEWTLANVMPVKWSIVAFDAAGNKVATETLELAHTGFLTEAK